MYTSAFCVIFDTVSVTPWRSSIRNLPTGVLAMEERREKGKERGEGEGERRERGREREGEGEGEGEGERERERRGEERIT